MFIICFVPHFYSSTLPFFFYSNNDHRDLHSFPTRRSSDLVNAYKTIRIEHGFNAGNGLLFQVRLALTIDRKSTRLNSSHRCISYAVFCLKKKKLYNLKDNPLERSNLYSDRQYASMISRYGG